MMIKWHLVMVAVLMSMSAASVVSGADRQEPQADRQGVPHQLEVIQGQLVVIERQVSAILVPFQAAVRFTPPLILSDSDATVTCFVVNVTSVNQEVQVDLLRGDGTSTNVGFSVTLGPREAQQSIQLQATGTYYCRFEIVNGSRTDIRASIAVRESPFAAITATLPAE